MFGRLIVFAPFLIIIKSPKQSLGDLLFLLRFLLLLLFLLFLFLFFLSAKHELVHSRSQELQDRISWNLVELKIYFPVDPKVFRFVIKGVKAIFWGSKGVGVTIESYGKLEISYINVDNF